MLELEPIAFARLVKDLERVACWTAGAEYFKVSTISRSDEDADSIILFVELTRSQSKALRASLAQVSVSDALRERYGASVRSW